MHHEADSDEGVKILHKHQIFAFYMYMCILKKLLKSSIFNFISFRFFKRENLQSTRRRSASCPNLEHIGSRNELDSDAKDGLREDTSSESGMTS